VVVATLPDFGRDAFARDGQVIDVEEGVGGGEGGRLGILMKLRRTVLKKLYLRNKLRNEDSGMNL